MHEELVGRLRQKIIEKSGLTPEILEKGRSLPKSDPMIEFEEIMSAFLEIYRGKNILYGDFIKPGDLENKNFRLTEHFCDIKRKYTRAENFITKTAEGEEIDISELLDTYVDLGVYAILGVSLINRIISRTVPEKVVEVV